MLGVEVLVIKTSYNIFIVVIIFLIVKIAM